MSIEFIKSNEDAIRIAIHGIKKGNHTYFNVIYSTYYSLILNFLKRKTSNVHLSEDLTSDTFLKFFTGIDRYQHTNKSNLRSYLFSIAFRNFVDHYRKNKSLTFVDVKGELEDCLLVDPFLLENRIDKAVRRNSLHRAIEYLSADQRRVVELFYFEELSYNEIQEKLKIPQGTIKARLNRARNFLKCRLLKVLAFKDLHFN